MRPEWEPVRGFVPHVVKPPASTRRTPRRYFPGLASCCKLGSGLLGIWVMGKIIVSIYLFALSVSNSKNDLGSTETSSFDGTEDPDLNSTTDLLTTSTPFMYFYVFIHPFIHSFLHSFCILLQLPLLPDPCLEISSPTTLYPSLRRRGRPHWLLPCPNELPSDPNILVLKPSFRFP